MDFLKQHKIRMAKQKPINKWLRLLLLLIIVYVLLLGVNNALIRSKNKINNIAREYLQEKTCEDFVKYQNKYRESEVKETIRVKCEVLGYTLE